MNKIIFDDKSKSLIQITSLIIYFLLGIFLLFDFSSLNHFFIYMCIHLFVSLLLFKTLDIRLLSLPVIFLLLSIMFHFGHVILTVFNSTTDMPFAPLYYLNSAYTFKSLKIVLSTHYFLVLGLFIYQKYINKNKQEQYITKDLNSSKLNNIAFKRVCVFLFIISFIPVIAINTYKLVLYAQGGYLNTYFNLSGLNLFYNSFLLMSLIGFMILNKENAKSKIILIVTVLLNMIFMFSGNRITYTINIICCFLAYLYINNKKVNLLYLILLIPILNLIIYIGDNRSGDISFVGFISNIFSFNIIEELLGEFGCTLINIPKAIEAFPDIVNYGYGRTYLYSLLYVIPKIQTLIPALENYTTYVYFYPDHFALGGSYIGELYYNFGSFAPLFAILIGFSLSYIQNKFESSIKNQNYLITLLCIPIIAFLIGWIRGYFTNIVRIIFWGNVFVYLLYKFFDWNTSKSFIKQNSFLAKN